MCYNRLMDKLQALNAFWSGFDLKAYDETSVPDEMRGAFPYITYEASVADFGHEVAQTASLWYYGTSWVDAVAKEKQIAAYISKGGRYVPFDGGAFIIRRGSPWAQHMAESSDADIRRIVLNVTVEYID